jgi:AraC family transcriptional regulator
MEMMSGEKRKPSGLLNEDVLKRLEEFVIEHLDEPLGVAALAKLTNRSQFHFSRAFTRSIGVSPYRYVVHLRVQRAVALVREGKFGLAEIAARTGFADQSHLTRWVRRVHGVSPNQILLDREPNGRNLQDRPASSVLGSSRDSEAG